MAGLVNFLHRCNALMPKVEITAQNGYVLVTYHSFSNKHDGPEFAQVVLFLSTYITLKRLIKLSIFPSLLPPHQKCPSSSPNFVYTLSRPTSPLLCTFLHPPQPLCYWQSCNTCYLQYLYQPFTEHGFVSFLFFSVGLIYPSMP